MSDRHHNGAHASLGAITGMEPIERACAACAVMFTVPPGKGAWRVKYCSKKCRTLGAKRLEASRQPRECQGCGQAIGGADESVTRGRWKRFCSDFCRTMARHKRAASVPLCVTQGCRNKREYSSGLCNTCYYRLRNRSKPRAPGRYRSLTSHGYVSVRDPHHPLSTLSGSVYEHRKVLYDAIGPGPHACRWCQASVDWVKGLCVRGALVPDHLDGDKSNNDISNLVPACNRCNSSRGLFMSWIRRHSDDPVLWQMYQLARASA